MPFKRYCLFLSTLIVLYIALYISQKFRIDIWYILLPFLLCLILHPFSFHTIDYTDFLRTQWHNQALKGLRTFIIDWGIIRIGIPLTSFFLLKSFFIDLSISVKWYDYIFDGIGLLIGCIWAIIIWNAHQHHLKKMRVSDQV